MPPNRLRSCGAIVPEPSHVLAALGLAHRAYQGMRAVYGSLRPERDLADRLADALAENLRVYAPEVAADRDGIASELRRYSEIEDGHHGLVARRVDSRWDATAPGSGPPPSG